MGVSGSWPNRVFLILGRPDLGRFRVVLVGRQHFRIFSVLEILGQQRRDNNRCNTDDKNARLAIGINVVDRVRQDKRVEVIPCLLPNRIPIKPPLEVGFVESVANSCTRKTRHARFEYGSRPIILANVLTSGSSSPHRGHGNQTVQRSCAAGHIVCFSGPDSAAIDDITGLVPIFCKPVLSLSLRSSPSGTGSRAARCRCVDGSDSQAVGPSSPCLRKLQQRRQSTSVTQDPIKAPAKVETIAAYVAVRRTSISTLRSDLCTVTSVSDGMTAL